MGNIMYRNAGMSESQEKEFSKLLWEYTDGGSDEDEATEEYVKGLKEYVLSHASPGLRKHLTEVS